MNTPKAIVTLAAAAVLGAAGGAAVVGVVGDDGGSTKTVLEPASAQPQKISVAQSSGDALSAKQIYAGARDSVVYITSEITAQSSASDPYSEQSGQSGEATGSGFVVSKEGYIVTNAHVVNGAASVTVKIGDGNTQRAEVVGKDESTDIALLKVAPDDSLKPLSFADSDALTVGDDVFAIGNPFGLDRTLTTGVVSALQRQMTAPNGYTISGVIQTDAPINPGNSGGPLLDDEGHVIGVNSQILTGSSSSEGNVGIGFAAPSNTVKNVVEQLEQNGSVKHAYLGVQMGATESGSGATVASLTSDGPAADAGVQAGDVIVGFDGRSVADAAALSGFVNGKSVGDKVELTVRRDGAEKKISVTLGEQPAGAAASSSQSQQVDPRQQVDPQQQVDPNQQVDPQQQLPQQSDPYGQQTDPYGQSDPYGQQSDPYGDPSQQQGQSQQQIDPEQLLQELMP